MTAERTMSARQADEAGWRYVPPPPALVFLLLLVLVPFTMPLQLLNADGDLARHIRHGEYVLAHGDVIRHDPFSFSRPGEPFVGFEYGSQAMLAAFHAVGGLPAVVLLSALLIALSFAALCALLEEEGVDPLVALGTTLLAALVSAMFWVSRPHLFTQLFAVLLIGLLLRLARGPSRRALLLATTLFVVWANVHGGWLFGLLLVGIMAAGTWLDAEGSFVTRFRASEVRRLLLLVALGAAATLLTPYGPAMPAHVVDFFQLRYILDRTAEFQSPDFHRGPQRLFLVALLGCTALLARLRRRVPWAILLPVLATIAFALHAQRNIGLFAVVALPLLAIECRAELAALVAGSRLHQPIERSARLGRSAPWLAAGGIAALALAATGGRIGSMQVVKAEFWDNRFPVHAVERARAAGLTGRLLHEFTWGGYVLYAWPEQKVFIDGGSDFYGVALMREYVEIWNREPGWREKIAARGFELALLPTESALADELRREPGWTTWFSDSTAVLLRRTP